MGAALERCTARALATGIAAGEITSEAAVTACLERIAAREPVVGAWQHLDPDAALAQARARDREPPRGPLHGVPVGVKDIMDTPDMPTTYGSSIYAGHRPAADAACVARLRAAGAVVLGKTVSTEFATFKPAKTANPHDPGHTPGGSSSGSAAAVADFMVPLALGSQTVGSVIRPAAFCGVVGFKPTYGRFDLAGVKALAEGLDTLGFFARTVDDAVLLAGALEGRPWDAPKESASCRIGLCRTPDWHHAQPETRAALENSAQRLTAAGYEAHNLDLPEGFETLGEAHQTIFTAEAVRALALEWRDHRAALSPKLQALLREGEACPEARYRAAVETARRYRDRLDDVFANVDVLLAPSAPGEAPAGRESTGDPVLNRLWTLLHVPCVTLPVARGPHGLPVGIQLIGARTQDEALLARAAAIERIPG
jgi:Asp-tRNA(Asn)/Glu-tRNA(Gln) amidotransferase A subunit family amidase